jgi:uncharacterized protein YqjF (DUF2071 family)
VNTREILHTVGHRPFPLPGGPWVMTQIWNHLLFAHWPIPPEALRPLIPPVLPLDLFDGQCWVGIAPFYMTHVCPRGLPPFPYLSQFGEINVRTYVIVQNIPGVYFFSLDANNPIAVWLARMIFHLPYFTARIRIQRKGDSFHYYSQRTHSPAHSEAFSATYRPISSVYQAQRETLEYWLIERYCLYTVVEQNKVFRANIHHKPWPLQQAEAEIMHNSLASTDGLHLPATPPLLHYANKQEVLVWPLRPVSL